MSKLTTIFLKGCALAFLLILFCIDVSITAPPPLRDEVLLNGTWSFTPSGGAATSITVPGYWNDSGFTGTKRATYIRNVTVPSVWAGKIIKLEFEGVLHVADVYVNGQFVGSHVGGYIPFSFDITDKVTAGSAFTLRVDVKIDTSPFLDANGYPLWPIGFDRDLVCGGIIFDVWLRAYGKVHIVDSFIQTSYRNKTLKVDYTLMNSDSISHTVLIKGDTTTIGVSFNSPSVTLAAGEQKAVQAVVSWPDPSLWTPATPNLYTLNSKVMEGAAKVDEENKRFGFREIWIEGNQFILNGIRVNLRGDSDYLFSARRGPITVANLLRKTAMENPVTYSTLMDRLLNFNIRVLRLHGSPAPDGVLDMADEKGMIIIEESAVTAHAAKFSETPENKATFISNLKTTWIRDWVKARRNHPSIFIWSADNESGCPTLSWGSCFYSGPEEKSLGDTIRLYDTTRPVDYDGDENAPDDLLVNYHYIEGWNKFPTSPYQFVPLVYANKPTGVGEYLSKSDKPDTDKQNARWWHGLMTRGLRYNNFTDIRPWTRDWYLDEPNSERALYFKNSFAPIALFDKDYDGLGIAPLKDGLYPSLDEGANVRRTLILYNDDFSDTNVTVEVKVMSGSTLYASGSKSFLLALGKHIDIPCNFQVPYVGGSTIDLVLTTKKGGVQKFQETKRFKVAGKGLSGNSSNVINLGSGTDGGFFQVGKQKSKLFIMLIGYLCWIVWKRRSRQP